MNDVEIVTIGSYTPGGVYLLCIRVAADLQVRFGRFKGGKPVSLTAGDYCYLGSALARGNTPRLGQRLARHTTRTDGKPPHGIRPALLAYFAAQGLGADKLLPKKEKKLFWHVDYLLDCEEAEIASIYLIPTRTAIESALARFLEVQPETAVLVKGLGARDDPGRTHLLKVNAGADWWANLPQSLVGFKDNISEGNGDDVYHFDD